MAKANKDFSEKMTVQAEKLMDKIKELIAEGDVRRIIVRNKDGHKLLNLPLTGGAAAIGVITMAAPAVAGLGLVAGLASSLQVEIVRDKPAKTAGESAEDLAADLREMAEEDSGDTEIVEAEIVDDED